jgi:general secretion pathway protein G
MLVVIFIISLLAAVAVPMVETSVKRGQELKLRRALRDLRTAIDEYKAFVDKNQIEVDDDTYGYPPDLDILVQGLEYRDQEGNTRIRKFLRRIPLDPMTGSRDWGLRSYEDEPDSDYWGGDNIFDVYTKSPLIALDGSSYREW